MKAVILYSTTTPDNESAYHVIPTPAGKVYIRADVKECDGLMHALDTAKPLRGETVLNTIPAPVDGQ